MKFRNLFKNLFKRYRKELIKDEEIILGVESHDRPTIIYKGSSIRTMLGEWMNINKEKKRINLSRYESLEDLIDNIGIDSSILNKVDLIFGSILKMTGAKRNETCILDQFDPENFSFVCHFVKQNLDTTIKLKWDEQKQIEFTHQGFTRIYDYQQLEHGTSLDLKQCKNKNALTKNIYRRNYSDKLFFSELESEQYIFTIEIERNLSSSKGKNYHLKNEEKLNQYLSQITFPIDIYRLYSKICSILKGTSNYSSISLKVKEKKTDIITDFIDVKDGNIKKLRITKNGKMREYDEYPLDNYNWDNDSNDYPTSSINQSAKEDEQPKVKKKVKP